MKVISSGNTYEVFDDTLQLQEYRLKIFII